MSFKKKKNSDSSLLYPFALGYVQCLQTSLRPMNNELYEFYHNPSVKLPILNFPENNKKKTHPNKQRALPRWEMLIIDI